MPIKQPFDLSIYLVIGPDDTTGRPLRDVVAAALRGGITFLQLRAKNCDVAEIIDLARDLSAEIATQHKENQVTFVINDRADAVFACRALGIKVDGVHIGQSDLPAAICRQLLGSDAIIGLSAHPADTSAAAINALPKGIIDYVGFGPVHPSPTKPNCGELDGTVHVQGTAGAARFAQACRLPVVAGGGVTVADVPTLAQSKVAGFFVVSAIAAAPDPQTATSELATAWHRPL
jgi:thiamine-phosphate diphosphorylase